MTTKLTACALILAAVSAVNAEDFRRVAFQTAMPAKTAPKIDGVVDDACWQTADWNDRYYEYLKSNPKRVSPGTRNAIVWDKDGIYIAVVNPEPKPEKIKRSVTRNHHGVTWTDDCAELYIDPDAKGIGYYKFTVNSRGFFDDMWQMDRANAINEWNSEGVKTAATVDFTNKMWCAEIYIPWNDLGRSSPVAPGDLWMFDHNRFRFAEKGWNDFCSSAPEASYTSPDKFGYLLFSAGELPDFKEIAKRVATRLKLSWFIEIGEHLAFNDADGLHFTTAEEFEAKTKAENDRLQKYADLIPTVLAATNVLEKCEITPRKEQQKPTEYDGYNGYYLYHLQQTYITDHLDWGRNLESTPKVMFGVNSYGARMRHIAELIERVDFKWTLFTTCWGWTLGGHGPYDDPVAGGTPNEAEARFGNQLRLNPDVITFWGFKFINLRSDFRYEVLRRMKDEGVGLILFSCETPPEFRKLKRLPNEEQDIIRLAPYTADCLKVYEFGKGRLYTLNGLKDRGWTPEWSADWESRNAFMGRLVLAASRKLTSELIPGEITQEKITVTNSLPNGTEVYWRMRSARNEIVREGTAKSAPELTFNLNGLPAGNFTLDLIAKNAKAQTREFGYIPFTRDSEVSGFVINAPHYVDDAGPFTAEVEWTNASPRAAKVELTLRDMPYCRLRVAKEYKVSSKQKSVSQKFKNYPVSTMSGLLEAKLLDNDGNVIDSAWKLIYFPNDRWPVYPQVNWQDLNTDGLVAFNAPRMVEEWGWDCNLCEEGPYSALFNSRGQPVIALLRMGAWDKGAVRGTLSGSLFHWNSKRITEAQKEVEYDENPWRPEVRAIIERECKERVEKSRAYGHLCYNLGDECGYSTGAGYGPSDATYFPEFLKRKYGSIKKYNAIRGTNYTSFAEIPHKKLKEARDADDAQSWFDQIQYAEAIYAEAMKIHKDAIVKYEPRARVGAEGSSPGDLELTVKELKYWGPYRSRVQNELLREITAPDVLRGVWWGGYVNEPRDGLIRYQWERMITGGSNCDLWYTAEVGSSMGMHNGAFEPAPYFIKELPHLNDLRYGSGQQLVVTPLHRQGLALWYSHESNRAAEIEETCAQPGETQNAFFEFAYRHGLGVELITKNRLEALANQKVVILPGAHAITEEEIAALKKFKAKGGIVICDVTPCRFTQWLTTRKPDDRPLDGIGPVLGESMSVTWQKMKDPAAFDAKFLDLLAQYDIKPLYEIQGPVYQRTIMRVRDGEGFSLVSILFPKEADGGKYKLVFNDSKPRHVYKVDGGYVGFVSEIDLGADRYPWYQFSLFDEVQSAPTMKIRGIDGDNAKQGDTISLDMKPLRKNGVYRMEISGPRTGKEVICVKNGKTSWSFNFALDDTVGTYTFKLVDLATGLATEKQIALQ